MLEYTIEKQMQLEGYKLICGVDEAGRGPLCGPVTAAAVILPDGLYIEGMNDSKKLTPAKRDALYDVITKEAIAWSVCNASVDEINATDILSATLLAMRRAIAALDPKPDFALIDGNCSRGFEIPTETVVKGDAKSYSIAAASILAKVTRDRGCVELDREYPVYGIAKHKGYPTKEHMDAVRKYGPSPIHRRSFLKFLNNENS